MLKEEDRDATRFLWYENVLSPDPPVVYRFRRIAFGLKASPYLLAAILNHHLSKYEGELIQSIKDNIYVDNIFVPIYDPKEVVETANRIRQIFGKGKFNVRQFTSDCVEELSNYPPELKELREEVSFLGLKWRPCEDIITFNLPTLERNPTKRNIYPA